jgi:hypothetical protein
VFRFRMDPNLKVGGGSVAPFSHDELATDPSVMRHDCAKIRQPPWLPQRIMGPGRLDVMQRRTDKRRLDSDPEGASPKEPERPEAAGDTPRDLTSRSITSRPDDGSWDFDGNEQDFGEEGNPPKPHASP